jgi:hypothetical protein
MRPGNRVELRSSFDGRWLAGFEVVEALDGGYRVRRLSAGEVLPVTFDADDVRRERRRQTWWL